MVVTFVWMHSWAAIAISICVLMILVLFLIICLCWEGKSTKTLKQFYVLDENGMKKLTDDSNTSDVEANSTGFFRRFSSTGALKPYFSFGNRMDTNKVLSNYQREHTIENEKDLLDSLDFEKQFRQSRLQIDICDQQYLQISKEPDDDCLSCTSHDSRNTFYSVYPYARTNSVAETMKSANSHPEMLDI